MINDPNASPLRAQVMAAVTGHFDAKAPGQIEVEEWGDASGPLVIHHTPMTVAEVARIYGDYAREDPKVFTEILIMKALDAQGKPLFSIADRSALTHHADPAIIQDVARRIVNYSGDRPRAVDGTQAGNGAGAGAAA